jgi:hypothetical protein
MNQDPRIDRQRWIAVAREARSVQMMSTEIVRDLDSYSGLVDDDGQPYLADATEQRIDLLANAVRRLNAVAI